MESVARCSSFLCAFGGEFSFSSLPGRTRGLRLLAVEFLGRRSRSCVSTCLSPMLTPLIFFPSFFDTPYALVGVMLSLFMLLTSSCLVLQVRLLLATLMVGALRLTASIIPAFCSSCGHFKTGLVTAG